MLLAPDVPGDCAEVRDRAGNIRFLSVRSMPLRGPGQQPGGKVVVLQDITGRKAIEAELERKTLDMATLANTDHLTGLPNRRYVSEVLGAEVSRAFRYGIPLSVALCDLDHFKSINDEHGHAVGDQVLRAMGSALKEGARDTDVASRVTCLVAFWTPCCWGVDSHTT